MKAATTIRKIMAGNKIVVPSKIGIRRRAFTRAVAVCLLSLLLSGCALRLLFLEEAELAMVRRAAVSELAEARAAGGLMRAARMGITAEDISLIERSTAVIRSGRLLAADEVAFNSQLGRIRMIRSSAGNPRLILRGATEPFAEVLAREGRIRLFNGHIISLHNDIYSVEAGIAVVRQNPWMTPNNTVATLRQGDLLVRLNEQNGWYQVNIVQAGRELSGFVEARLLVPLVLLAARDDRKKNASPYLTIVAEERARWDYYWATPGGIDAPQVSASDAMTILFHRFGQTGLNRRIAYSEKDWPIDVTSFVRMAADNLPILSVNRFKDERLATYRVHESWGIAPVFSRFVTKGSN